MEVKLVGCNCDFDTKTSTEDLSINKQISPESLCAAYGRISRSKSSISELRKDAKYSIELARKSNEKIVFDYGHSSIAEHAVLNFDISGISRLAVEELEKHRLVSYTEKSQRYVNFSNSGFYKFKNDLISKWDKVAYVRHVDKCFSLYSELEKTGIIPLEDCRYVLPLCVTTDVGMTVNARNLEYMIQGFLKSDLEEVKELGQKLYDEAIIRIPSLIKLRFDSYQDELKKNMNQFFNDNCNKTVDNSIYNYLKKKNSLLVNFNDRSDTTILLNYMLSEFGTTLCPIFNLNYVKNFYKSIFKNMTKHSQVPKAFESICFGFSLLLSSSGFAQLKRHRMATILPHPYLSFPEGFSSYSTPQSFIFSGKLDSFTNLVKDTKNLFYKWKNKYPSMKSFCNYLILNANTRICEVTMNMRSLYNFSRLRCDSHAQWEIRELANEMIEQVKTVAPLSGTMLGGKSDFDKIYENGMKELEKI